MDNHYHLLHKMLDANLYKSMRQLNGVYTQRLNRAHGRTGHVFQGSYKAMLAQKNSNLLGISCSIRCGREW
jgi:putative transposase